MDDLTQCFPTSKRRAVKLDHLMFAVPDLDAGIAQLKKLTGVNATPGGSHPGAGTRNALLSLGNQQYLEIIAPDPAQQLAGTLGEELQALPKPFLRTWAVASQDFKHLQQQLEKLGYDHRVIDMQRTTPAGIHLAWQILFVTSQPYGLAMPFFIDWLDSPHPAQAAPVAGRLAGFNVRCPDAEGYRRFCELLGLEVIVAEGDTALSAEIRSGEATVSLT